MMTRMLVPHELMISPAERELDRVCEWINSRNILCEDWTPDSDVAETEKHYVVTMELPGVDMKKVDITFDDGAVRVKGVKDKETSEGECCHCSERFFGAFNRTIRVGGNVDRDKIEASYKDGVLKLVLPKTEESIPKKIEIH
ncbi:MAG: Hsp20/alpha crystallin family protein [Deltaproteobacteria bacterium HGW-Deltaproteobacteria-21]|nr:MAG: Hsp20/alpha crystallin family protein [Deltaproteobacteria bacterium HGW-Deltaproteobacteria-21]